MASSINASTSAGVITTADTSGVLNIQTAGTTAISIDASQAVSFTNAPTVTGGTANGVAYLNGSKVLTTGSALVFDASGNLGIGTTSPSDTIGYGRALDIQSTTGAAIYLRDSDNPTTQYAAIAFDGNASVNNLNIINSSSTGPIRLFTNGAERARIDSSGNLLVGTTSTNQSHRLIGKVQNAWTTEFFAPWASNNYGISVNYTAAAPNTTWFWFYYAGDTGGQRFGVASNGGISNYSANNVNLSDRREKTNFAPAKSYLDVICAIPVQTFNYIDQNMEDDGGLTLGVVAQDVQAVAPELVMESNWGTEDDPKMRLSIYQTDLQYALMKCIQEQQAIIQSLTARITVLENK